MKKTVAIVMTALSAAATLYAAPLSASACCDKIFDMHACISLFDDAEGTVMNQDITVVDCDGDFRLTYLDALISAEYEYNPVASYGFSCTWVSGSPAKFGEIFGVPGAYTVYLSDSTNDTTYGLNPNERLQDIELDHANWDTIHVIPYRADHPTYAIECKSWSNVSESYYSCEDDADLRAVCYPAGCNTAVPVSNARIVIDGTETDYVTDLNGYVKIRMTGGSHTLSAIFPNMPDDAITANSLNYTVYTNEPYEETERVYQAVADQTAETAVTTALTTTTAETATTTAAASAVQTAASETVQTFATTSLSVTAPVSTTAAPAATTAPAAYKPASDTQKVGSLKTGDSTPVAALLLAGIAAGCSAAALTAKKKKH